MAIINTRLIQNDRLFYFLEEYQIVPDIYRPIDLDTLSEESIRILADSVANSVLETNPAYTALEILTSAGLVGSGSGSGTTPPPPTNSYQETVLNNVTSGLLFEGIKPYAKFIVYAFSVDTRDYFSYEIFAAWNPTDGINYTISNYLGNVDYDENYFDISYAGGYLRYSIVNYPKPINIRVMTLIGDINGDGVQGDFDGDNIVDQSDLTVLTNNYGLREGDPGFNPEVDLNKDGRVNAYDYRYLRRIIQGP